MTLEQLAAWAAAVDAWMQAFETWRKDVELIEEFMAMQSNLGPAPRLTDFVGPTQKVEFL